MRAGLVAPFALDRYVRFLDPDTGAGAGGEGDGTSSDAGGSADGDTGRSGAGSTEGGASSETDGEQALPQAVKDLIAKLRRTERAQAKALADATTKLKTHEDAQLSETERLQAQVKEHTEKSTTLASALQTERVQNAVELTAHQLGIVDPEAAYLLVDKSTIAVGEDGRVDRASVKTALEALVAARPYLKAAPAAAAPAKSGSATNPDRAKGQPSLTRKVVEAMPSKERSAFVNTNWDAISAAMKDGSYYR